MKYLFGGGFMDDCIQFFALQSPMNPSQIGIIKVQRPSAYQREYVVLQGLNHPLIKPRVYGVCCNASLGMTETYQY
jgi:hypothetical protein